MNKYIRTFMLVLFCFSLLLASGEAPKKADDTAAKQTAQAVYEKEYLIDNFDDADIKSAPAWWTFDRINITFPEAKNEQNGLYYAKITGPAENYYVGGMGTYLGIDASQYDTLTVSVYGNGPNSGTLRLQLYEDDNNTYQLEQDSTYKPLYDDYLEYELPVNWEGWRTIEVPLAKFVDMNQGVGDDIFNPDQKNGSGGLLHFQFVVIATSEKGAANIDIDNIKLIKKAQ